MTSLEETVVRRLQTIRYHLCTVESCTGGLISHRITNVPGSSEIFWGGQIVYDDSAKRALGVPENLLKEFGAVSFEVAQSLAENGLQSLEKNTWKSSSFSLIKPEGLISIATTGIAGPGGGTSIKPVGLCFIALAISGRPTQVEKFMTSASKREQVKQDFSSRALELIRSNT